MKDRLLSVLDQYLGGLFTLGAVLLYLVLLAGRGALGRAYLPLICVLVGGLAGLGVRSLVRRGELALRLRASGPFLLLGAIVVLAVLIRLWRAPQMRPADDGEAFFVEAALGIIRTGNYIPPSLRYPSLLVYVELATAVLRFVAGASANLWTWPTQLVPAHLYGWGRGAVALLSAATVLPTFWIGETLYGRRAGLLAALFLALLPMHVAAGGIVGPEALATLLVLLAAWFALRLLEEGRPCWALAAGAWAGLAAAAHYPAGLMAGAVVAAVFLRRPGGASRGTLLLLALLAAPAAFLLGCPAALAQTDRLVAGLVEAARAYFPPQGTAGSGLLYLLRQGLGWGPALLALLGAALVIPRLRRAEVVLFTFPVLFYLALLLPRARFPGDLTLLSPFLALLAAAGVERGGDRLEERFAGRPWRRWLRWATALLAAGLFALALRTSAVP